LEIQLWLIEKLLLTETITADQGKRKLSLDQKLNTLQNSCNVSGWMECFVWMPGVIY